MHRLFLAAAVLLPLTAAAQTSPPVTPSHTASPGDMQHGAGMPGMPGGMMPGAPRPTSAMPGPMMQAPMMGRAMMHGQMMRGQMMRGPMMRRMGTPGMPTAAGQAAFGAIQEIVAILEADPHTDWSKVNIDALRHHLVDMDNVTLRARVTEQPITDGMVFVVTGSGPVTGSIRRMIQAHVATMNGAGPWRYEAADIKGGAKLTVHVPAADMAKLKGLGFFGVLVSGMHHQEHHLMIARGMQPHS